MNLNWFRRQREEELDAEIRSHLDEAIRDRIARGEAPDEARVNALREFGNVGLVKEVTRGMWGLGFAGTTEAGRALWAAEESGFFVGGVAVTGLCRWSHFSRVGFQRDSVAKQVFDGWESTQQSRAYEKTNRWNILFGLVSGDSQAGVSAASVSATVAHAGVGRGQAS
jgi:hypothetical protein